MQALSNTPPPTREVATVPEPSPEDLAVLRGGRRRWQGWAAGGVLVALVAAAGAWWLSAGSDSAWETEEAFVGTLATRVTAVGELEPVESVEVGSDQSGVVAEVLVDKNDRVEAGDVLARLDTEPFENAVTQAKAQLASAAASVELRRVELRSAEQTRDRTARLEARGAATAVDVEGAVDSADAARANLRAAEAQYAQAKASLERAEQDLADAVIVSPIGGVVIQRFVDPGQTVVSAMSATALFEVASDLESMQVEVGVDEADVGRVAPGQQVSFTVSAWPDRTFEAEVLSVDLAPDPTATVVSYLTELRVDNADGSLRPGMTATAEIVVDELADVVQVPSLALRFTPPRATSFGPPARSQGAEVPTVWALEGDEPVAHEVRVLGTNGVYTAVSGIEPGTAVIIGGE